MISSEINQTPTNDGYMFPETSIAIIPGLEGTAIPCPRLVGMAETVMVKADQTGVTSAHRIRKPRKSVTPVIHLFAYAPENLKDRTRLSGKVTIKRDELESCDARFVGDVTARHFHPYFDILVPVLIMGSACFC